MTRLEEFLHFLARVIVPAPKGRHHQPAGAAKAPLDDTAPIPALARNPYPHPQEHR